MDESLAALLRTELADLHAYAPAERPGIVLRLDANEPPPALTGSIRDAVARAVSRVPLERYPDPRATALKEKIAERTGAKVSDLIIGSGSDEIIALLATALARPREKAPQPVVLLPTPTFVMYRITARVHGWKPVEVPLDATWDLDVATMKRAVDMVRPNIVYIASPNNPTGNRVSEARLAELCEHAKEALVVLDEAYVDYAGDSLRAWRDKYPNLAVLRTLSKIGLAALRVGWLEADAGLVRELDKARTPFNVSATSQAAAAMVLSDAWDDVRTLVATVNTERTRVAAAIAKLPGFNVSPSAANFLWVKTPRPAEETYEALARKGVLVRSFHMGGGRLLHQLRVTIGAPADNDRLLEALGS